MTPILKKLKSGAMVFYSWRMDNGELLDECARELERLEDALRKIGYGPPDEGDPKDLLNQFVAIAQEALNHHPEVEP